MAGQRAARSAAKREPSNNFSQFPELDGSHKRAMTEWIDSEG
jgi:hypothetical protein